MAGKKTVADISHQFYSRPPQDNKPAMFAYSFPCLIAYIQTVDHLAVTELAMQYPVGLKLVDIRISLYKVRCMYIFELDLIVSIVCPKLFYFCAAQGAESIIKNGKSDSH